MQTTPDPAERSSPPTPAEPPARAPSVADCEDNESVAGEEDPGAGIDQPAPDGTGRQRGADRR